MDSREWVLLAGVTALAAALRIFALGEIPPGLYHDEAFNGLDALKVLAGEWPVYFAANHGREPLFIYLIASTVGLLGRTPGALRLAAAISGTLTIPATYLVARAWFNRRLAALSATVLTITLWHVHLSRIGFRAVTLPLMTALTLWLGTRAYRSRRGHDWLLTGLSYGLCFYTYLPARFTPLALLILTLYLILRDRGNRLWPGLAWFVGGTSLALAPLAIYTMGHWEIVMGRPDQVSVFNPLINGGDLWGTLGRQLVSTVGMFFVRGDAIPRHNLPGRPVFDVLLGASMVLGVARAVLRARHEIAPAFVLIWVGLMLVPTWLAEDAPHYLRAVGVLPLLALFPALGLDAAMAWLEERGGHMWSILLACAVLSFGLAATVRDYFVRYGRDPQAAYAFEDAATELAAEANRFLGIGWDGAGLTAQGGSPNPGRRVYVDRWLWNEWAALPFLVPQTEGMIRVPTETTPPPLEEGKGEVLLLVWPYEGLERLQELLPRNSRIEAHAGPLTKGDLEDAPYPAYVAYTAGPKIEQPAHYLVRFGDQIALVDYTVELNNDRWKVELVWEALASVPENYVAFVHLRDGERLLAQDDGEPTEGSYPTRLWRSGDTVVDTHVLKQPRDDSNGEAQLVMGLYVWPTLERLEARDQSGELMGDEFALSIE